jgi:hypothetical protein
MLAEIIDHKTIGLMSYYEKLRRKNGAKYFFIFSRKDPKKAKYWTQFREIVLESLKKDSVIPDPNIWIDAQFEVLKLRKIDEKFICPPNYLFGERAWKRYHRYVDILCQDKSIVEHNRKNDVINTIPIIAEIKETYRFLRKYFRNNYGSEEIVFSKFLGQEENESFLMNRKVSYYLLANSKSYSEYKTCHLIGDLSIYKKVTEAHPEIKELLAGLFGEHEIC